MSDHENSRAEHLAWCKERALEYVERREYANAVASMLSDLRKHPETAASGGPAFVMLGIDAVRRADPEGVRKFITGFN